MCWFYGTFIAILISLVVPGLLMALLSSYKDFILNSFPTARGIAAWLMLGWLQGAIVCGIAYIFYKPPNPYLDENHPVPDNPKEW